MSILGTNTSVSLSKEVDAALSTFSNVINKLKVTVTKVQESKTEKQEEIKKFQDETVALDEISTKATGLISKLETLCS